ncbi:DUF171-domain-containing protein [Dothidotthia symphoricarpi CBS 119687]|uniref:DUF171-domain-containing protein n=1 Tax=Dothidotthia symphoricarpi CBS 119687 TaxID=1392245 RepID=A0A6A6AJX8_9PLEO|nr:DUF171-domain-containing protein [Dothidotthia symphoricarpi CBS 119687]KAF2131856.1 DUF171-domain-containing protein [Dothidotthia symphoricarpi CBS 119687]
MKGVQDMKRKLSSVAIHKKGDEEDDNSSPSKKLRSSAPPDADVDTSRPTALFKPTKARDWTVSIALPGSWLLNAKKPDHKTMQVGRIARAAAVFCVDEVIVFDDDPGNTAPSYISPNYLRKAKGKKTKQELLDSILEEDEPWQNPDQFLYHVLSFAECPPHLRHNHEDPSLSIFQVHKNLEWAGCLPSMDMPHHLRGHEWCRYREGVVIGPAPAPPSSSSTPKSKSKKTKTPAPEPQQHVYVHCGLPHPVRVSAPASAPIEPGMRTTVRFTTPSAPPSWPHLSQSACESLAATACESSLPRQEAGYYWGYTVRRAASLSAVFSECEFPDGYDYTIGTSERGVDVRAVLPGGDHAAPQKFKHLLLVFGGVAGLEPAVANDAMLVEKGLGKATAHTLFDAWVNLVPGQGSRTIRTEEAVEFGLCALKPYVDSMYGGE